MKHVLAVLLSAFLLAVAVVGAVQFKKRRDLDQHTILAVQILRSLYVRTPNQDLRIVFANAWHGNVCLEYVSQDAREQDSIRYAVFEKDSKSEIDYDMDQEDLGNLCNLAGVDLTNVAEEELKDLTVRRVE